MPPPGLLRLKVMAFRVLAVEVAILGSELTILDLFATEFFVCCKDAPVVLCSKCPLILDLILYHMSISIDMSRILTKIIVTCQGY